MWCDNCDFVTHVSDSITDVSDTFTIDKIG